MRLSEYKGDEALDVLADLIEPSAEIFSDKKISAMYKDGATRKVDIIKAVLKNHKKSIVEIMAALDREDPATYTVNLLSLPAKILEILNDPELESLFGSAAQTGAVNSSGAASGIVEN